MLGGTPNVSNYRLISILSHISKTFEFLVFNDIQPAFNSILIEEQHGFHPKRSSITGNLVFNSYVIDAFQCRAQVDVFYIDFLKAFYSRILVLVIRFLLSLDTSLGTGNNG